MLTSIESLFVGRFECLQKYFQDITLDFIKSVTYREFIKYIIVPSYDLLLLKVFCILHLRDYFFDNESDYIYTIDLKEDYELDAKVDSLIKSPRYIRLKPYFNDIYCLELKYFTVEEIVKSIPKDYDRILTQIFCYDVLYSYLDEMPNNYDSDDSDDPDESSESNLSESPSLISSDESNESDDSDDSDDSDEKILMIDYYYDKINESDGEPNERDEYEYLVNHYFDGIYVSDMVYFTEHELLFSIKRRDRILMKRFCRRFLKDLFYDTIQY